MPIRDKVRGKIGQPRVPEWADDENEEIEGDIRPTREATLEKALPPHEEEEEEVEGDTTPIVRKDDHLLFRRAEVVFVPTTEEEARRREGLGLEEEDEEEEEEEEGEELSVWRPVFVPKIREGLELEGEDEEEEEDALAERRGRQIKDKNKMQEEALPQELAMAKPGFIPKREEPLEAEVGGLEEAKKRRLGSTDKESRKNMELEVNVSDVDTYDELNGAQEYKAWKAREIRRIKLDREVLRGNVEGVEHD